MTIFKCPRCHTVDDLRPYRGRVTCKNCGYRDGGKRCKNICAYCGSTDSVSLYRGEWTCQYCLDVPGRRRGDLEGRLRCANDERGAIDAWIGDLPPLSRDDILDLRERYGADCYSHFGDSAISAAEEQEDKTRLGNVRKQVSKNFIRDSAHEKRRAAARAAAAIENYEADNET